jgi:hypothetical protein
MNFIGKLSTFTWGLHATYNDEGDEDDDWPY